MGWQPVAAVQYTFTHKQHRTTQWNRIYRTEHTYQQEYINVTIKIHNLQNLQNWTEAYKTYNHIYSDKKNGTKRIWKNGINETAI